MRRLSVALFATLITLLAVSCPAPNMPGGDDADGDNDDVDVDVDVDIDDDDACALGERSRGPSESCCLAFGADACGANLFCGAFDGRAVPTCYVEHTRLDGEGCTVDTHCASGACADSGVCRASPGQPCSRETGCAAFAGEQYLCTDGVGDGDRCLLTSPTLGGVCGSADGCDSGFCVQGRCRSGDNDEDCVADDDCRSAHCVDNACASGDLGASCDDDDDCGSNLVDCAHDVFGYVCALGTCRRADGMTCADNAECASEVCDAVVRDRCVNPDGNVGARCTANADCGANQQCRPRSVDECVAP